MRKRLDCALRNRRNKLHCSTRTVTLRSEFLEPRNLLATVGGPITEDTVWTKAESPYEVTSDITVQVDATLNIEPGVEVLFDDGTGITVEGRFVAEGTAFDRLHFAASDGGRWDGLSFENTLADNRVTFADMVDGDDQGEAINVEFSRLLLDNIVWEGTTGTILELEHPSVIVRNSHFPTSNGGEIIHGEHIEGDEYLIIDGNVFENSDNGGDVIDVLGADRPGPVMQILNNVFKGGGDDGLDLDGTDAHVEGNVFMNFNKNTTRATTANAIATGLPQSGEDNRTQVTVVRNIFIDNDHAILLKEDAFATVENNLFIGTREAAIQFNEVGGTAVNGPGMGARLDGNIFSDNAALFKHLVDTNDFKTDLTIFNSRLPNEAIDFDGADVLPHSLGSGNIDADPRFVDQTNGNYRLAADSPAIGAGRYGIDMGAYVQGGPTVTKLNSASGPDVAAFAVSGPGITHYRFRINGEPYGELNPVDETILLSQLPSGDHQIDVLGMNSAGEWYVGETNAFRDNTARVIAPSVVGVNETFPMVVRVANWQGQTNPLFTQPVELVVDGSVGGTEPSTSLPIHVKKGVGSAAPPVPNNSTFEISLSSASNVGDADYDVEISSRPVQAYSGQLVGSTVWDSTSDHHITENLIIPMGSSLTIEAGARVLMDGLINIRVEGELNVNGTIDDPVVFNAADRTAPWGGLELADTTGSINYAFFTNGGADDTRAFGHSGSQPLIFVDSSTLDCDNCYVINNTGKAFGSSGDAIVNIHASVISDVDTGAQFNSSIVTVTDTWLKNIPNGDVEFDDDDNDGFYFSGVHSSGTPSRFQDSFIIETKDDGLDHNGARLEVISSWIEGADHEGIASSNRNDVRVVDSVFIGNNQGVEAGYRDPDLFVTNSVLFNNRNDVDPDSPITAGVRFGDGYDGSNGSYTGHIEARNIVSHDNGDNIRNWDGEIGAAQVGAIDIATSLTNDPDYDGTLGNQSGIPVFGPFMHLLRGSAGKELGNDGLDVGRLLPAVSMEFTIDRTNAGVRLSEIYATGTSGIDANYIELLNAGDSPLDLSGYTLTHELQAAETFTFPDGTMLGAGDYLTVTASMEIQAGTLTTGFELDPRGGTVRLTDATNLELDQIDYNQQIQHYSLTRSIGGEWTLGIPTPDESNQPAAMGSVHDLKINEWLAEAAANANDFVELYSTSGQPIDLGGLLITDDPNSLSGSTISPRTFIGAGELFVLNSLVAPDQVLPGLPIDLSSSGGTIAIASNGVLIDRITFRGQTSGVSQGRVPNGGDQIEFFDPPNPFQDNPEFFDANRISFRDGVFPTSDYAGTQDVWLRGTQPNTNFGNDDRMDADGQSGSSAEWTLLRWDVSSLEPGTTIDAASITLTINNSSNGSYEIFAMNSDWVETEATWNGPRTGQDWEIPGTGPSDRLVRLGTVDTGNSTGTFDFELNNDGLTIVESWVNDSASNFGVIIYNPDVTDGIEMRTSEYAAINARPMLTLEITPPEMRNTISFRDGVFPTSDYTGTEDVWLRGTQPNTNFGSDDRMDADGQSGSSAEWTLLRWDVSSIEPGSSVDTATITLAINNASSGTYDIFAMLTDWVESEATWNGPRSGQNWEIPGTGPTDRLVLLGSIDTGNSTGTFDFELNADGRAFVDSWINEPETNFGVIIYNPDVTDGIEMRTSEYVTVDARPMLTLDVVPPVARDPEVMAAFANLGSIPQSISTVFSEDVHVDVGDLRLRNRTTGEFILDFDFSYDVRSETAIWTVNSHGGVLPAGEYEASVSTEEVVDLDGNQLLANELVFTRFYGDTDGNQTVDAADIGTLCSAIGQPANGLVDLNGDGSVSAVDVEELVRTTLGTEFGDANLDGVVDGQDFTIWQTNRFATGTSWLTGDFTCDGTTDGSDFNVWSANRFTPSPVASRAARTPRSASRARFALDVAIADFQSLSGVSQRDFDQSSRITEPSRDEAFGQLARRSRQTNARRVVSGSSPLSFEAVGRDLTEWFESLG